MNTQIFEFDLNAKDLAVVEVLQNVASKAFNEAFDELDRIVKSIDIEVESIQIPLKNITKDLKEVGENVNADLKEWAGAIEDKKAEILKSEQDFSNYEVAMVSAKQNVNENIQALTVSSARAANKMDI